MYLSWNLQQLLSYVRTWSATRRKIAADGEQFLAQARRRPGAIRTSRARG